MIGIRAATLLVAPTHTHLKRNHYLLINLVQVRHQYNSLTLHTTQATMQLLFKRVAHHQGIAVRRAQDEGHESLDEYLEEADAPAPVQPATLVAVISLGFLT